MLRTESLKKTEGTELRREKQLQELQDKRQLEEKGVATFTQGLQMAQAHPTTRTLTNHMYNPALPLYSATANWLATPPLQGHYQEQNHDKNNNQSIALSRVHM